MRSFESLLFPWSGLFALIGGLAHGETIREIPYPEISAPPAMQTDFSEFYAHRTGPVMRLEGIVELEEVALAESFAGQENSPFTVTGGIEYDRMVGVPKNPLALRAGPQRKNLYWSWEADLHSFAIQGIAQNSGPTDGIGEGSIAILFTDAVCKFGFASYLETGKSVAGAFSKPGSVNVVVYRGDGTTIDSRILAYDGLRGFAFEQEGDPDPKIKGVLIQNSDRDGIAISSLRFTSSCSPMVS